MTLTYQLIDFKNPVFLSYALWSVILALKMLYMSVHTAFFRFKTKVCWCLEFFIRFLQFGKKSIDFFVFITTFQFIDVCQSGRCRPTKKCSIQCWGSRTCATVKFSFKFSNRSIFYRLIGSLWNDIPYLPF